MMLLIKTTLRWGETSNVQTQQISPTFFGHCVELFQKLASSDELVCELEIGDNKAHLYCYDKTTTIEDDCPKWATTFEIRPIQKNDAIHDGTYPYDDLLSAIKAYFP